MTQARLGVRMTVMFLTLASAAGAVWSRELPLRGTVQQEETQTVRFPDMSLEGTGVGNAKQQTIRLCASLADLVILVCPREKDEA